MRLHLPLLAALALALAAAGCGGSEEEAPGTAAPSQQPPRPGGATTRGVTGRVTDEAGAPVARALVTVRGLDRDAPAVPELAVYSDEDGRYAWSVPAGRWAVTVQAEGFRPATGEAEVPRDGRATLDLRLAREP